MVPASSPTRVLLAACLALIAFPALVLAGAATFNDEGALLRPQGYQEWVHLGTALTPNDLNDGHAAFPGFHEAYIDPASFRYYRQTGQFRDGAMIVMRLVEVGSKAAPSGRGYFEGQPTGLLASVKDEKRFPDEPGHWAYFSFGLKPPLAEAAQPTTSSRCAACHQANADRDMVFVQYWPVLRDIRPPQGPAAGLQGR